MPFHRQKHSLGLFYFNLPSESNISQAHYTSLQVCSVSYFKASENAKKYIQALII